MFNILGDNFIKEHVNKLNCYKGLYSCFDLNNFDTNEKYLNNCSDVFILNFLLINFYKGFLNVYYFLYYLILYFH